MRKVPEELSATELHRIARQLAIPGFGREQQNHLARAHVLVIGAGGLGCPIMQSLAAVGVGHLSVIDDDTVDLSNTHRQIHFGVAGRDLPKMEVAAERLHQLQPRLNSHNAQSLFESVDLVSDGSDTFATKYLAADAAEIDAVHQTAVVHCASGMRSDNCVTQWSDQAAQFGVELRSLPGGVNVVDKAELRS